MKSAKRILSLLLATLLLLSLFGCGKKDDEGDGEVVKKTVANSSDVRLPYSREDGVNPFSATSVLNQPLMPLLYEGLYYVDSAYQPHPELASSATISGGEIHVVLNHSKRFSDGSPVTGADVIYSFKKAQKSPYYASALTGFNSIKEESDGSLTVKLSRYDPYILADLVFPVVKADTAEKAAIPTGSGLYVYSVTDMGGLLKKNGSAKDSRSDDAAGRKAASGSFNQIYLLNTNDTSKLMYSLAVGNVNAVYDDITGGSITRVRVNYNQVPMNNVIVINLRQKEAMADPKIRQDLSLLLDRDTLINSGLDGYGVPASLPFNPSWYAAKGLKVKTPAKATAEKEIKEAFQGKTLSILTDADNPFKVKLADQLQTQLKALGITTNIASLNYGGYAKGAASGGYDFIIAEYKLTNSMYFPNMVMSKELKETYEDLLVGKATLQTFLNQYQAEMPFLTVAYRSGLLATSKSLETEPVMLPGDPYANVWEWKIG